LSDAVEEAIDQKIERYKKSGTPANTTAAYKMAVDHYRMVWGGLLPASELSIVRYLVCYSNKLAPSTLKLRLAGIAHWHREHGFTDPTKGPDVRLVMKGISREHTKEPRQATPLPFDYLKKMVGTLEDNILLARDKDDRAALLRHLRNRALLLLGFWRGFRSDELTRVSAETVKVFRGAHLDIFFPHTKNDPTGERSKMRAPALALHCPVEAYLDWIYESEIRTGPVFRKIDRWGNISDQAIFTKSIGPLLNAMAKDAGLEIHLSTHSLRHGFAQWAVNAGWDVHTIMSYVGWSNYKNAARYVPAKYDFGDLAISGAFSSSAASFLPANLEEGRTLTAKSELLDSHFVNTKSQD
tara:strand:- start:2370 stop:3431 length:1062 start_codon:yes stop_codon:yes gene_type:complete